MAEFVTITYTSASVSALTKNANKCLIIGRTTSFTGLINNVNSVSVLTDGTYPGILTTDPLYLAANTFLNEVGGAADLVLYAIPSSVSAQTDVLFNGVKNNLNTIFYSDYSPVDAITNLEVYPMQEDLMGTSSGYTGQWYSVTTGWEATSVNNIYDGSITLDSSGITFSGADPGEITGYTIGPDDKLRADVTPNALSLAFQELDNPNVAFRYFAFAYDHTKSSPIDPDPTSDYKYASGLCYSEKSWLYDAFIGGIMANRFSSIGNHCIFCHSLPEKVRPGDIISSGYTTGTSAFTTDYTYSDLKGLVGSNKFFSSFVSKQDYGANAKDPAIMAMANRMSNSPRLTLTFRPSTIAQTEYPKNPEHKAWEDAKINDFGRAKGLAGDTWLGNYTFGNGFEGTINHVDCKNILARKIYERIYSALSSSDVGFDIAGVSKIRSAIQSALNEMISLGWIDGNGTITIPDEPLILKEGSLTDADQATLDAHRKSGILDNISVTFKWNGNIITVKIVAFLGV